MAEAIANGSIRVLGPDVAATPPKKIERNASHAPRPTYVKPVIKRKR